MNDDEQTKNGRLLPDDGDIDLSIREEDRAARRARRRARARRVLDTKVPSPCVSICQIDPGNNCCIGCDRHIDEIRDWPILSAEEKRAVLALLPDRKAAKA